MKTRNLILFAAVILAASCVKDIDPVENNGPASEPAVLVPMEFTASVDTKAHLDNGSETVLWDDNEAICVFDNLAGDFKYTATEGGVTTCFSGNVTEGATEFYALYPYRSGAKYDSATGSISSKLFPDQYAVKGSYAQGDGGAVMVAKADDNKVLSFKNVTSHMRFTLAEDMTDVKSITLMGNRSEALCGTYSILWNNGEPTVEITDPVTYVTLRNADGSNLEPGAYFFTVLPVDFTAGFTVILSKEDKTQVAKRTDNPISQLNKRNQILPMAPLAKKDYSDHMNYFVQYNEGHDITIGGYTFNKNTHQNAVLVTDTKGNGNISNDGVYFIAPDATVAKFSKAAAYSSLIVIGSDSQSRSAFDFYRQGRPFDNGSVILMANLSCTVGDKNAFGQNRDTEGHAFNKFGKIVLSNCHFRNVGKNFMEFKLAAFNELNINVEDCEFGMSGGTVYILNASSLQSSLQNLSFRNNIFYAQTGAMVTAFKLIHSDNLTATSINFDTNTFDKTVIESNIIRIGDVTSTIDFSRNLFVGCSGSDQIKLFTLRANANPLAISGTITNNYYYATASEASIGAGIGNSAFANMTINSVATLDSTPFSTTWNPASETYGAYVYPDGVSNTVGAKRDDMKTPSTDDPAASYTSADLGTI